MTYREDELFFNYEMSHYCLKGHNQEVNQINQLQDLMPLSWNGHIFLIPRSQFVYLHKVAEIMIIAAIILL